MVSSDLGQFLEQGLSILVAVRDTGLAPYGARVWAVSLDENRTHITAYIHKSVAPRIVKHLETHPEVSLGFGRPTDHRACQVKGIFVGSRAASAKERGIVQRQFEGFSRELEAVGIPRSMTARWRTWPCVALSIRITDLFAQTPGPGAGAPMR